MVLSSINISSIIFIISHFIIALVFFFFNKSKKYPNHIDRDRIRKNPFLLLFYVGLILFLIIPLVHSFYYSIAETVIPINVLLNLYSIFIVSAILIFLGISTVNPDKLKYKHVFFVVIFIAFYSLLHFFLITPKIPAEFLTSQIFYFASQIMLGIAFFKMAILKKSNLSFKLFLIAGFIYPIDSIIRGIAYSGTISITPLSTLRLTASFSNLLVAILSLLALLSVYKVIDHKVKNSLDHLARKRKTKK